MFKSDFGGRSHDDQDGSATRVGFKSDFGSRVAYSRKHSRPYWVTMHELGG
jgi:hypothetical protein